MENYCPTLLAYVPVFLASPQPSAVVINRGRKVTGRIVPPRKKVSYTLTAGAGDELLPSTKAASGSLRADADFDSHVNASDSSCFRAVIFEEYLFCGHRSQSERLGCYGDV